MIRWHYSSEEYNVHSAEAYSAQAKKIGELLGDSQEGRVVVPEFQRGYSWGRKQVEAFWKDVEDFRANHKSKGSSDKHFFGPIVVMPSDSKDKDLILLDGQQRLATATILLSVLRDAANGLPITQAKVFAGTLQSGLIEKEDVGYSLKLGELDQPYFQETIQQFPPSAKKARILSHRTIASARGFLQASVQTLIASLSAAEAVELLKEIRGIVKNDLVMASIMVLDEPAAFRIFETLNDRGLRLSVPDLLLNYLMRKAATDDIRKQIRVQWNEMIEALAKRDSGRFIRHMWLSKYGDLKATDLFSALKEHIETNKKDPLEFAQTCGAECNRYVDLIKADEEHLQGATPYVRALISDLRQDTVLPVLLSAYTVLTPKELEDIAKWLLVFITRYSIVIGLDSGGMENIFYALARDIRKSMGAATTADKAKVKDTRSLVKKILIDNAPTDETIKDAIKKLILEPDEAKYVVHRLACAMQTKTKEITIDDSNIEHIFPKKPSAEWANPEELEPYLWHLGNLTMLGERLNQGAASKGYSAKKKDYYEKSELEMPQQLANNFTKWNVQAITKRAESFGKLVTQVWDFNNPSRV